MVGAKISRISQIDFIFKWKWKSTPARGLRSMISFSLTEGGLLVVMGVIEIISGGGSSSSSSCCCCFYYLFLALDLYERQKKSL